ncbi:MAG TPA: VCBS repeat-containing protein, partial [Acidimicrobiales bacterium]|nr:VCBS repeat-containing protein [Acidimicrobiales bacterium]
MGTTRLTRPSPASAGAAPDKAGPVGVTRGSAGTAAPVPGSVAGPHPGPGSSFTTRTELVAGGGAGPGRSQELHPSPLTSGGSSSLFVAPQPVSLGSLTSDGGGVVSMDTGHFDSSGDLDLAAITCQPCLSPDPASYQSADGAIYQVAVLLGNGDGTFGGPSVLSPPSGFYQGSPSNGFDVPLSMILADDLGNGQADLVVAEGGPPSQQSATILVYLGNGDGTFSSTPAEVTSPAPIVRIQAAALGDGHVDLVAAVTGAGVENAGDTSDNAIVVFSGNGEGDFSAGTPISLPPGTITDLAVAPLSNGGEPSIVATVATASKTTSLSVLLNNGSGGFPAAVANPDDEVNDPYGVEVGNFDGSSQPPDILVAGAHCTNSFETAACQVLVPGNGDGTFEDPSSSDATPLEGQSMRGPEDDASFDLNGDGDPDALWIPSYGNYSADGEMVEVALGTGNGGFDVHDVVGTLPADVLETAVLPAQLDASGPDDLLVAGMLTYGQPATDSPDSGLWVVPADPNDPGTYDTGGGMYEQPFTTGGVPYAQYDQSVVAGNFSGSGYEDLVQVYCAQGEGLACTELDVNLFPSNGDGTFGAVQTETFQISGPGPEFGLVTGDFNGDGKPDIAFAYTDNNGSGIVYLLGNGNGTFQQPVVVASGNAEVNGSDCCALASTTLDGVPDIVESVFADGGAQYLASWLWQGGADGSFAAPVVSGPITPLPGGSGDIAIGRFAPSDPLDVVTMSGAS